MKHYDLSTSTKWASLSAGNHQVTIVAKAQGYANSAPSAAVTVVKPQDVFNITDVLSNVTANGENPTTIAANDSVTLIYTAASGYKLPSSVTVTNATSSWEPSTGVLDISNPTGDVTVTITAVTIPRYTVTMNLTNMTFLPNVTTIKEGDSQTYELTASSGYTVPAKTAVTVTNATLSTYVAATSSKATMTISNPTGDVTIKADAIKDVFNIVNHLTNVTANGDNPSTIAANDSVTLTYTANTGYTLPDSITVTGATYTYNKSAGTVNVSNPTNDVSITIAGIKIGYDQTVHVGDDIDCSSLPYDDTYNIESSNTNVATAENDGGVWRATAVGVGEATISVTESTPEGSVIKGSIRVLVKAAASYTVTLTSWDEEKGHDNATLIKIGSAPTSMTDCTYRTGYYYGDTGLYNASGTKVTSPVTISNVSKVYLWQGGGYSTSTDTWSGAYKIDGVRHDYSDTEPGSIWSNPVVITLTKNIALSILHSQD